MKVSTGMIYNAIQIRGQLPRFFTLELLRAWVATKMSQIQSSMTRENDWLFLDYNDSILTTISFSYSLLVFFQIDFELEFYYSALT